MQGYRCCVSWFHHGDFLAEFEGITPVSDQIFVVDRDRLTCSGGASSAHLAAWLVDRHVGRAAATKSLHIMIMDDARTGEVPQPGLPVELSTDDPLVRHALALMRQSMEAPLTVERLAERLGVGRRALERHFRAALGPSPAAADRTIRLAQARFLLQRGDRSITRIPQDAGFCGVSHLIRVFRERECMTPEAWRLHARQQGIAEVV